MTFLILATESLCRLLQANRMNQECRPQPFLKLSRLLPLHGLLESQLLKSRVSLPRRRFQTSFTASESAPSLPDLPEIDLPRVDPLPLLCQMNSKPWGPGKGSMKLRSWAVLLRNDPSRVPPSSRLSAMIHRMSSHFPEQSEWQGRWNN